MGKADDEALRRVFGPSYVADHSQLLAGEYQRRAQETADVELERYRSGLPADHPDSPRYRAPVAPLVTAPVSSEVSTESDGYRGMVTTETLVASGEVANTVATEEVATGDDVSSSVSTETTDSWLETIRRWVVTRETVTATVTAGVTAHPGFSTEELLADAFEMSVEHLTEGDRRAAGKALAKLGYESRPVRIAGKVVRRWMKGE